MRVWCHWPEIRFLLQSEVESVPNEETENEEITIPRRADHRDLEAAEEWSFDGCRVPRARDQLGDELQVEGQLPYPAALGIRS